MCPNIQSWAWASGQGPRTATYTEECLKTQFSRVWHSGGKKEAESGTMVTAVRGQWTGGYKSQDRGGWLEAGHRG